MKISKKLLAGLIVFSLVGVAFATMPLLAATTATVSATVTPRVLSVSVSPTSVGYGVVDIGSTDNAPVTPTSDPVIVATNNGSGTEKLNIKGANATGTTVNWTITTGVPGGPTTYNYNHKFGVPAYGTFTVMDGTSYTTLVASLGQGLTQDFKLRLSPPTDAGGDYSEHSTAVTVQAVAP